MLSSVVRGKKRKKTKPDWMNLRVFPFGGGHLHSYASRAAEKKSKRRSSVAAVPTKNFLSFCFISITPLLPSGFGAQRITGNFIVHVR